MGSILVLYNLKWSHIFVRIYFWIEETKLALMLAFNQSKSWSHNLSMIGLNTGENWINFLLLSELHKMTMDGHLAHSAMTRQWNWTPIAIIESEYLSFGGEFTSKECFWSKKRMRVCVCVCICVCVWVCVRMCEPEGEEEALSRLWNDQWGQMNRQNVSAWINAKISLRDN